MFNMWHAHRPSPMGRCRSRRTKVALRSRQCLSQGLPIDHLRKDGAGVPKHLWGCSQSQSRRGSWPPPTTSCRCAGTAEMQRYPDERSVLLRNSRTQTHHCEHGLARCWGVQVEWWDIFSWDKVEPRRVCLWLRGEVWCCSSLVAGGKGQHFFGVRWRGDLVTSHDELACDLLTASNFCACLRVLGSVLSLAVLGLAISRKVLIVGVPCGVFSFLQSRLLSPVFLFLLWKRAPGICCVLADDSVLPLAREWDIPRTEQLVWGYGWYEQVGRIDAR